MQRLQPFRRTRCDLRAGRSDPLSAGAAAAAPGTQEVRLRRLLVGLVLAR
jgi:hypothetical protein